MDTKNNVFTAKDDKGHVVTYEIIFKFDSEETKKSYIVYTDHVKEKGKVRVYASIYDKIGTSKELLPIETEKEWNTVEALLSKFEELLNKSGSDIDAKN